MKNLKGRVAWLFGNNFDVDLIIGIENISQTDPEVLKKVCMKPYEEDFAEKVKEGDLIVAGLKTSATATLILKPCSLSGSLASPAFWPNPMLPPFFEAR